MIQSARTNTGLLSASATAINIKFLIFISYLQPCLGCKIRRVLQEPDHLHKTLPTFSARLIDRQDIIDSLSSNHMYQAHLLVCQKLSFQFSWSRTSALAPVFVFPVDPNIIFFWEFGWMIIAGVSFIPVALSEIKSFDQDHDVAFVKKTTFMVWESCRNVPDSSNFAWTVESLTSEKKLIHRIFLKA